MASVVACTGGGDGPLFGPVEDSGTDRDVKVTPPTPTTTATTTSTVPPPKPPIPPEPEPEPETCKAAGVVFTPPPINPPAAKQTGACTETQIEALATACAKEPEGAGCTTARNATAATCASCVFGAKTDANWKPIILTPGETPPARYNQPGCIDLASNVSGCGKKYMTVVACFDKFCADCTGAEETACQKDVAQGSGECKNYLIDQACGNALDSVEKTCFPAEQTDAAIKALFVNMVSLFCK